MEQAAGWIAPIATMIGAMMTAANLGARLTGWGFVVFTVGSIAWTTVGFTTGQTNLVAANGFLILVNAFGIWRWLGRQAAYEDGARSAEASSRAAVSSTLFPATGIGAMTVMDKDGVRIGHAVEALLECSSGAIDYIGVASGGVAGVDEQLRAVPSDQIDFACKTLKLRIAKRDFTALPILRPGHWPASAGLVAA